MELGISIVFFRQTNHHHMHKLILTRGSRNAKNGLFRNEPFHAVFHVQSQQHHLVVVRGWDQVERFQPRGKGIDSRQDFCIRAVDVRSRKAIGAHGTKAKTGAQRVQFVPKPKCFVQSAASLVSQFGMTPRRSSTNVASLVFPRRLGNDRR